MTDPQFTASDADFAAALRISLDCPQCAASKDLQRFYAQKHDDHVAAINAMEMKLSFQYNAHHATKLDMAGAAEQHRKHVHIWRLIAFAGWFTVALGMVTRVWK